MRLMTTIFILAVSLSSPTTFSRTQFDHLPKLNQAVKHDPTSPNALFQRGNGYLRVGLLNHAIADYTTIIEQYNRRGESFSEVVTDSFQVVFTDGIYQHSDAIEHISGEMTVQQYDTNAFLDDAKVTIGVSEGVIGTHLNRAIAYILFSKPDSAIADLDYILGIDSDNKWVHLYKGYAYSLKSDHQAALSEYERSVSEQSDLLSVLGKRGVASAQVSMGDFASALQTISEDSIWSNFGSKLRETWLQIAIDQGTAPPSLKSGMSAQEVCAVLPFDLQIVFVQGNVSWNLSYQLDHYMSIDFVNGALSSWKISNATMDAMVRHQFRRLWGIRTISAAELAYQETEYKMFLRWRKPIRFHFMTNINFTGVSSTDSSNGFESGIGGGLGGALNYRLNDLISLHCEVWYNIKTTYLKDDYNSDLTAPYYELATIDFVPTIRVWPTNLIHFNVYLSGGFEYRSLSSISLKSEGTNEAPPEASSDLRTTTSDNSTALTFGIGFMRQFRSGLFANIELRYSMGNEFLMGDQKVKMSSPQLIFGLGF